MVDFLSIVKYLVVFVIGYVALGVVLNDFWFKVLGGIALAAAVLLYEAFTSSDHARRLLRAHVHVYRR